MKPGPDKMKPVLFPTAAGFRKWLASNHDRAREIWVGLYKGKNKTKGITYSQALAQALCYGWIDAVRKSINEEKWTIRFTPRKPGSNWSLVNVKRAKQLIDLGLMKPAGVKAFESRRQDKTGIYSYEQEKAQFSPSFEVKFRKARKAWEFFGRQPASYRKVAIHWVMRAKKEETRMKRLNELIAESSKGKRLARFGG